MLRWWTLHYILYWEINPRICMILCNAWTYVNPFEMCTFTCFYPVEWGLYGFSFLKDIVAMKKVTSRSCWSEIDGEPQKFLLDFNWKYTQHCNDMSTATNKWNVALYFYFVIKFITISQYGNYFTWLLLYIC